jgi:hypothetical protein
MLYFVRTKMPLTASKRWRGRDAFPAVRGRRSESRRLVRVVARTLNFSLGGLVVEVLHVPI